jgi:hypothetical protein
MLPLSMTHEPATDLGFLLHKNPERVHAVEMPFCTVTVVYSEATAERCTAALLVEVDPVGLVRNRKGPKRNEFSLTHYVNDRPYAASSFLSVAMNKVFGTAPTGRSKERPDLAETAIPFTAHLPVVPCRGGESILRRLFEPRGGRAGRGALGGTPSMKTAGRRGQRRLGRRVRVECRRRCEP